MSKKSCLIAILSIAALSMMFALSACDNVSNTWHTHSWSVKWSANETHHWHNCIVSGCTEKNSYKVHDYSDGDCVCGKENPNPVEPHTHSWSTEWNANETHHWHNCTVSGCTEKNSYKVHDYSDGDCVCGKENPDKPNIIYRLNADGNGYTAIGLQNVTATDISIFSKYKNMPVTAVDDFAFMGCNGLKSVKIGDNVTNIGEKAFYGCSGITNLVVPDSVEHIGSGAFGGCNGLTSIQLPFVGESASGESNVHFGYIFGAETDEGNKKVMPAGLNKITVTGGKLGRNAFSECDKIATVTIGDNVTEVDNYAFNNCVNLSNLTIGNKVSRLDYGAFYGCGSLASVVIPNSVKYIGALAFCGTAITEIEIPDSVTEITWRAFYACSLKKVKFGNGLETLGYGVFENCTGLTEIVLPDGLKSIGNSTFYGCTGLTKVVLPDGLESIGNSAFYGCTGLTEMIIPNSVTSIGKGVLEKCDRLATVKIPFCGDGTPGGNVYFCYIFGATSYNEQRSKMPSYLKNVTIGRGTISKEAFRDCRTITHVILGDEVTEIGERAFYECYYLRSVVIGNGVKIIGKSVFGGLNNLEEVKIGDGVEKIGTEVFTNCPKLTSINIPVSVTEIGYWFFAWSGVTEINYAGTKEQWKSITMSSTWDYETKDYTIICTDGTLSKNELNNEL